ncbi:nitrate ABC transporter ATP-binding protein [Megasphaera cerevisiae DSM 20462]|uniref:Nitrate ABC transporter ATP-binding protein n=1 Tax=Megasphaera cerevisiae DSM 20462 TaxID=1122219 RepID=A0A0J6WVB3_9FIRM|nr:nitrate/sulfonate/bicarbonate ABC transporter ATP-binding protein [Megasphaera cerevisiae]KMO85752.1 nitrate ABC transporter ATP-binding protein [Megasphaera cerevisiae DSM 20462]SKA16696.1 NitT/TauT family transport system ATP-binding protein [Megasphaera cerevisiae DSM 20462]
MNELLTLTGIGRNFKVKGAEKTAILKDVNISVKEGEFVAILGPSGAGKSTLLRIIAGLISPSAGTVSYLGHPITGVNPGVAMVFQSFALFPWLTILDNVMLGLEGKNMTKQEKEERSMKILDVVGLDGFESAFPKELSGGMRQRVGIGRALVSEPDILLMDEAFSALDVLTAENLRRDLLSLWLEKKIPTKSIILVTHGIEEAVYMADRAIILSTRPATVRENLPIPLPRWRDRKSTEFLSYVDQIYAFMTNPDTAAPADKIKKQVSVPAAEPLGSEPTLLPNVTAGALTGFLEMLADLGGKTDLYKLADRFVMDIEDFFPLVEMSNLLRFSTVSEGDIFLTPAGEAFAKASVLDRKNLFRQHLLDNVPFVRAMVQRLETDSDQKMDIDYFEDQLASSMGDSKAAQQMDLIIGWMRYAELIEYDNVSEQVYFEEP